MHRPYFNTVCMDGEPSAIDTAIRDVMADPDRGLFETLIGRNLNIDDYHTHNMTMYGTNHDVVINSIQIFTPPFMRDDLRRWTFGFRSRYMPLEFISALARRFECAIEYHAESHADTDSWSNLYATYNRRGVITYTGQTPPTKEWTTTLDRAGWIGTNGNNAPHHYIETTKTKCIMNEYLTTDDAARYLRIAKRTVYHLIHTGQIKPIQNQKRGRIRFTISSLDAYADPSTTK